MKKLEKYWIYIVVVFGFCMFIKLTLCFIILGALFFYLGFHYLAILKIIKEYGIQTTGKILKYTRGWKGYQAPTINFSTRNGIVVEKEPYIYTSTDLNKFRSFKNYIGKSVEVKYNPKNPEEFIIATQKNFNSLFIYFSLFVGFIFLSIGILELLDIIQVN